MTAAKACLAEELASWACELEPSQADLELAQRSLQDTLAVMIAARDHELRPVWEQLGPAGRWAAQAHVLDYDDLHLPSTAHISAVCLPAALATNGGARAYLAGARAMARLGAALGWGHYRAGWHATCTAGAPAAAVTAAVASGLRAEQVATAVALAIPAAGGVQTAFGTAAKSLQVGFAADAGVRAAELAAAGASADPAALDAWFELVGGEDATRTVTVEDGLAIKIYPCCYALQRPVHAMLELAELGAAEVRQVRVRTPVSSLKPLIHHRPVTGLQGKFSLEYGLTAALLDGPPGLDSFSDAAVRRPEAAELMQRIEVSTSGDGDGLLAGEVAIEVRLQGGGSRETSLALPPGAPGRPPSPSELRHKLETCAGPLAAEIEAATFETAHALP